MPAGFGAWFSLAGIKKIHHLPEILPELMGSELDLLHSESIPQDLVRRLESRYQEFLGQDRGSSARSATRRQLRGAFYTSPEIIRFILSLTIPPDLEPSRANFLDLSCGSGQFLVGVVDYISENDSGLSISRFISENLYGVDLDPVAVELCLLHLLSKLPVNDRQSPPVLGQHLFQENSLIEESAGEWARGEFDYILGNPPYILGDYIPIPEKTYLQEKYSSVYHGEADYAFYFIKRGIDLLRDGGCFGFIIPRYLYKGHFGASLREYIMRACKIRAIVDFGNVDMFAGVGTRCSILILEKMRTKEREYEFPMVRVKKRKVNVEARALLEEISTVFKKLENSADVTAQNAIGFRVQASFLGREPWILTSSSVDGLYRRLHSQFPSIREYGIKVGRGGITGSPIFSRSMQEVEEMGLEPEVWFENLRNSDIQAFSIGPLEGRVLFLDNCTEISCLAAYPNTYNYLMEALESLAFTRREFRPPNSPFSKKELDLLKGLGRHPAQGSALSSSLKEKILALPYATSQDHKILLDTRDTRFHDHWQWWRWTSPRNLEVFYNPRGVIACPYIAPTNRFVFLRRPVMNATGDVLGIQVNDELPVNPHALVALLNSRLYNFLYRARAKKKDYRYEYYPKPVSELPMPSSANSPSFSKVEDEIIQLGRDLEALFSIRQELMDRIEQHTRRISASSKVPLKEIFQHLDERGFTVQFNSDFDTPTPSVAFRLDFKDKILRVEAFTPNSSVWFEVARIHLPEDTKIFSLIHGLYGLLASYLDKHQIPARTAWRRGKLISEILLRHIKFLLPEGWNIDFLSEVEKISRPTKRDSLGINLFEIDQAIRIKDERLNNLIYQVFQVSTEERELLEKEIEHEIPYLP